MVLGYMHVSFLDECHVHVVRRMGRSLHKVKTDMKTAKKPSKGLTAPSMQAVINFYSQAIGKNKGNAREMSRVAWAILYHYID